MEGQAVRSNRNAPLFGIIKRNDNKSGKVFDHGREDGIKDAQTCGDYPGWKRQMGKK